MHPATRVIRAGLPMPEQGDPLLPGPVFAGIYHLAGEPATSPYSYGRFGNPTWAHWEQALSGLEGGPAIAFASGMAALTAVLATVLRPGDIAVMPADGYYTGRVLMQEWFAAMGVQLRTCPTTQMQSSPDLLAGARLLCLETPSNPGLDVCDIAALSAAAHARDVLVAVDNTTATALGQQPLALGADFSLAADTKALSGHGDLLLGHVAVRDDSWAGQLHTWRTRTGCIPGPMEVWLAHRALATAQLRLERMGENALALARFLCDRAPVRGVRYPGLEGDPSHAIAARQMQWFGPIVSFELPNRLAAERFLSACTLVTEATSFGSVHTTAERRARWGGDVVPDGFIRMSAGCEHIDDLILDLTHALEIAAG